MMGSLAQLTQPSAFATMNRVTTAPSADRHVLHVVRSLEVGGLERLVADMVRVRGVERTSVACLCTAGAFGQSLAEAGASVRTYAGRDSRLGRMAWFRQIIRELRPEIIHCHNIYSFLYAGLVSRWCRHPGLVFTKHGQTIPETPMVRWLFPWLLQRSAVVGVSPDIRDSMTSRFPACGDKTRYIRNSVDMSAYSSSTNGTVVRNELSASADTVVLGSIGRLTVEKGYDVLLQAFANLSTSGRKLLLVIAGDGPCHDALAEQIRELDLSDKVLLLGERHDVPQLLASFDAFVLASRSEGQPLSVIEAMAAGKPVIATTAGGIPTLVRHGVSGLLVPPNDPSALHAALIRFLDQPDEFLALGQTAQQTAKETLGLPQMLAAYEQVYEDTLTYG